MMELIKMGNVAHASSITFSAPIPFPARLTEYLKEFTGEHFPGKPIFTTIMLPGVNIFKDHSDTQAYEITMMGVKLSTAPVVQNKSADTTKPTLDPEAKHNIQRSWLQKLIFSEKFREI